jgi:NADPH:quinone reductase-like Zn-dependent oxidoreductase
MRAWNVPAAGAQPTISELPVPEPGPGSVLVRVKAAGLNALDAALAAGYMAQMMPHEYPFVLGRDAAGVVEAVGEGVDHVRPGDEVIGHVLLVPPIRQGTLADYALLPAEAVTPKPSNLDFEAAAALPLAGTAALAAVDAVNPQPGQAVLVVGASGGVGSYAVQLAAARGATVVATGTPDDADRLTKLGATTVVDHTAGSVAEQVRVAYPAGVDALIDLVARTPDGLPLAAVRAGGVVASTAGAADEQALAARGLTGGNLLARASREVVGPLAEQAAAGALTIDIGQTLPFERAGEGLAAFFDGHVRGKTVVRI